MTDITPSDWSAYAVLFGAGVSPACLAITGSGKPCTYSAYGGEAFCGTHQDANDPEVLEWAHQWARVEDGGDVVAVCVRCGDVWQGGIPGILVDCPTCGAEAGKRCHVQSNRPGVSAAFPPHPERRRLAMEQHVQYRRCAFNPFRDQADDQANE